MKKILFLAAFAMIFGVAIAQEEKAPQEKPPMEKPDKMPEKPDTTQMKAGKPGNPPADKPDQNPDQKPAEKK